MLVMFTRALRRRFPVLANRNFRLLLADRLVAPMAATFSLVGVSFAVLAATGSTADLSYVIAAQAAPSLVFLLIGGVIADRIAPQLVIVAANVMMAVGEGLFGILVLTSRPGVWVMVLLELLTGTGIALFYPASMALLPRLVSAGQMREASAISRLTMNAAMMAGAALAGECVALLGAAVARAHLGGPAAWGLISAAEATGLIVGGLIALRWAPSRPILYVVLIGGAIAISPLSLAMLLPLWVVCVTSFVLGVAIETLAVLWTVTMAAKIPADKLARVSAYDALGTTMGMPAGALVAGPLAARFGVSATQYGAAAITLVATALALIPREVWTMRSGPEPIAAGAPAADDAVIVAEPVLAGAALADASTR